MIDFKSLRAKSSLAIIVTAAVLVEITSGIQYYFAKEGIREEVEHRAGSELRAKSLEIRNVMNVVEVAVENMAWAVEQRLPQPDSMWTVTQKLLEDNEYIVGSAVAFEPYYYPRKGRQFSPYSYKHDSTITSIQLGTDQYDYHAMEWYTAPMESGRGIVAIAKSTHIQRMIHNFDIFDFALSEQDMLDIATLNRNDNGFRDFDDPNYLRRILAMFDL